MTWNKRRVQVYKKGSSFSRFGVLEVLGVLGGLRLFSRHPWPLTVREISVDCQCYIGRLSHNMSQKFRLSVSDVLYYLYAFHPFLVSLKNFQRLHVRIMCANSLNSFKSHYVKQDTQVKYCQIHKIQKKGLGFVSLATLDLYKEASEKRGVDQGCLRCTTEVTNQG